MTSRPFYDNRPWCVLIFSGTTCVITKCFWQSNFGVIFLCVMFAGSIRNSYPCLSVTICRTTICLIVNRHVKRYVIVRVIFPCLFFQVGFWRSFSLYKGPRVSFYVLICICNRDVRILGASGVVLFPIVRVSSVRKYCPSSVQSIFGSNMEANSIR